MNIFLIILTANVFSFYFISQGQFHKKWHLDFKPFNCSICLTAWAGLGIYFLPEFLQYPVLALFGSGFIAPFFRNFFTNLYFKQ